MLWTSLRSGCQENTVMTGSPAAVCHIDVAPSYAQGTSAADHPMTSRAVSVHRMS